MERYPVSCVYKRGVKQVTHLSGGVTLIVIKDLTKRYEDGVLALDQLNLEVDEGEIFCLLGANGAGKTTTINLLLNFIEPTEGMATINDIDVTREPLLAKRHIAYVSDVVMLYPNFSARQNLDYFARLGGKKDYTKDDYYNILRRVGLQEEAFERKLKTYSKGMRQKTGLAIAIAKDAPVIILDEPTSGLDPKAADEFVHLLLEIKSEGKSIFMSTHDIFRTREMADKVGIMKKGNLITLLSREELKNQDLEELYLEYMQT
jgi:ABC-2 type transport system ATP-binding protein